MDFNDPLIILLIILLGIILLSLISFLGSNIAKKRKIKKTGIEEDHGVRYTADSNIGTEDAPQISYIKEDIIILQNTLEVVGKNNKIKSGKYTILSTIEGMDSFYVRIGSYVRGIKHGSEVVLAEGDRITPVSCSIILR